MIYKNSLVYDYIDNIFNDKLKKETFCETIKKIFSNIFNNTSLYSGYDVNNNNYDIFSDKFIVRKYNDNELKYNIDFNITKSKHELFKRTVNKYILSEAYKNFNDINDNNFTQHINVTDITINNNLFNSQLNAKLYSYKQDNQKQFVINEHYSTNWTPHISLFNVDNKIFNNDNTIDNKEKATKYRDTFKNSVSKTKPISVVNLWSVTENKQMTVGNFNGSLDCIHISYGKSFDYVKF
jgi:hypothetical protein